MAEVKYHHVGKKFGEHEVIPDLDLHIKDGEFIVYVGPSGCGKTTLLRMLAGLETLSAGQIWIGDNNVTNMSPKHRNVAMVFQNYALYPHMTVAENIGFGLMVRGTPKSDRRKKIEQAAALLDIDNLLDRKPKEISGGQRQRVAMGRAIVREPDVFLMDEPLSNLDAQLRHQMRAELRNIQQRLGVTMVYVTHDQVEAMTMADRIVVLDKGQIQQLGTPREIFQKPKNRFVASFIGTPHMNILPWEQCRGHGITVPDAFQDLCNHHHVYDIGFRPADMTLADEDGVIKLTIKTLLVENLGNDVLVHGQIGGEGGHVRALIPTEQAPSQGDELAVAISLSKLHLFDEKGEAIRSS